MITPGYDSYGSETHKTRRMPVMHYQLRMALATLLVSTLCFFGVNLNAQSQTSSLCVAPNSAETPQRCAPGLCDSGDLSLKIDHRPIQSWPKSESMKIDGLSISERHRVVIYRAKKAQQSFVFRFSDFKSRRPCLFLNDLYWTAQLWESSTAPWCKCQ